MPLKDLKTSNPVELAEYAIANKINHEPAFLWWVKDVMGKEVEDQVLADVSQVWH